MSCNRLAGFPYLLCQGLVARFGFSTLSASFRSVSIVNPPASRTSSVSYSLSRSTNGRASLSIPRAATSSRSAAWSPASVENDESVP